jgi:xanthine/uracil/vitamin C permease (AzgA family)
MFAAAVGTSTSGAFIESAAGVEAGGSTGLTAVVTALCFAGTLLFAFHCRHPGASVEARSDRSRTLDAFSGDENSVP